MPQLAPPTLSNVEFFRNNKHLKQAGSAMNLTQDQQDEIIKCSRDPEYFMRTYIKVVNADGKIGPFNPRIYQQKMIRSFIQNRNTIVKAARQSGKSSCVAAFMIWYALFNKNRFIALLANKEKKALELMKRIQFSYVRLPIWLQQGIVEWNKSTIELENGTTLFADATSSDTIRGYTISLLYLDEFAFVGKGREATAAEDFWAGVYPTISEGKATKCIITSTPQGMNFFYKLWNDAEHGKNDFTTITVHWSEVPGRDAAWADRERRNLGEVKFEQEHNLEFLGSAHTLISGSKLRILQSAYKEPIDAKDPSLRIWKVPVPGHLYLLAVDVAEGQNLDYSVIQIIDATVIPYEQVGVYRSNEISPYVLPTVIWQLANEYNMAYVLIEITTVGLQVAQLLQYDIGYENLIKLVPKGRMGQQVAGGFTKNVTFGLKQSKATKRIGCANLKTLVESDKLILVDFTTIQEMTTFVATNESFAAEPGYHDDCVMSLVVFGWLSSQRFWHDATDLNMRKVLQKETGILENDESVIPFGIIDDGTEDKDEAAFKELYAPKEVTWSGGSFF